MQVVNATIASTAPVDGLVLPMDERADLSRVDVGAVPVLVDHQDSARAVVGKVERVWVDGENLRAELSIADEGIERQLASGAEPNVSIGFIVKGEQQDASGQRVATSWQLAEVSLVSVGRDPSAGIGRGAVMQDIQKREHPGVATQPVTHQAAYQPPMQPGGVSVPQQAPHPQVPPVPAQPDGVVAERQRVRSLMDMGRNFGLPDDEIMLAVAGGDSPAQLEQRIRQRGLNGGDQTVRTAPAILPASSVGDSHRFSLRRLMLSIAEGESSPEREQCKRNQVGESRRSAFEIPRHIADEIVWKRNQPRQQRTLTAGTAAAGAELVGTTHLGAEYVDVLRPSTFLDRVGVRRLMLSADADIPGSSGAATASWLADDNAAVTESDLDTETAVELRPHQISTLSSYSRRLLVQSMPSVDSLIEADARAVLERAIEKAVLDGTGTSGQPQGITTLSGVAKDTFNNNGTDIVYSGAGTNQEDVLAMLGAISSEDIDPMMVSWVMSSALYYHLKGITLEPAGTGQSAYPKYLIENMMMAERPVVMTNLASSGVTKGTATNGTGLLVAADWSQCIVAEFGSLSVVADPYSQLANHRIRLSLVTEVDVAWRHAEAVARVLDAKHIA